MGLVLSSVLSKMTTPAKIVGRRLERESILEPTSTLEAGWFSAFAQQQPVSSPANGKAQQQRRSVETAVVSGSAGIPPQRKSGVVPLSKSTQSSMNKTAASKSAKVLPSAKPPAESAPAPPPASIKVGGGGAPPPAPVPSSLSSTRDAAAAEDPLEQLHTLQGVPTDRLLSMNVRVDAKKNPHIPGFYGNPRSERSRSAALMASVATSAAHQKLALDRERILSNLVITSQHAAAHRSHGGGSRLDRPRLSSRKRRRRGGGDRAP